MNYIICFTQTREIGKVMSFVGEKYAAAASVFVVPDIGNKFKSRKRILRLYTYHHLD
jgi:hypothetical protein